MNHLFFLLAGVILLAAFSLMPVERWVRESGSGRSLLALLAAMVVLTSGFVVCSAEMRAEKRFYPLQPMREAVTLVRGEAPAYAGRHEAMITASVGAGNREMLSYDPRVHDCDTVGELDAVVSMARQLGKPLVVYASGNQYRSDYHFSHAPALWSRLTDHRLFVQSDFVSSPNPFWSYSIFRLQPAAQP